MEFGLLNNDCLWVFDEVQLMSTGLAASLQLNAWLKTLRLRGASGFLEDREPADAATGARPLKQQRTS